MIEIFSEKSWKITWNSFYSDIGSELIRKNVK